MIYQRFASRSAWAGEEADYFARDSCFEQNVDEERGNRWRIARRFNDGGVSGDDGSNRHAAHDCSRKIPGRDDYAHAERNVLHIIVFTAHWRQLLRRAQAHHFASVVSAKTNRFA